MNKITSFLMIAFILLLATISFAGEGTTESYSLWIGGHYTDFSDYTKKVGEYNLGKDETLPELKLGYFSQSSSSLFRLNAHYYDKYNASGSLRFTESDRFMLKARYRSLVKQIGQDLLENAEAREYLPTTSSPSGKMLTHELLDAGADYQVHRQEILAEVSAKLAEKNNLRFVATHRTILKSGSTQSIAGTHCFSCHLTSQSQVVDNKQHQFEAGLDASAGKLDLGYRFGYRKFESEAPQGMVYFDEAKHPTLGTSGSEFSSRQIFDDSTVAYNTLPKTEKMYHKVRVKGNMGKSRIVGTAGYSKATNKDTDLAVESYNGSVNYATVLDPRTRFIAKATVAKLSADTIFIDLPTYRDGAADGNTKDFDFTRYSAYDRTEFKFSGEVIKRMNPKTTLSLLAGLDVTNRDNYPVVDDGTSTKKFYGQANVKYRNSNIFNTSLKYRFEAITDPFISGRGLFEMKGNDILTSPISGSFIFYWEREDLRYQSITTEPTQVHRFFWNNTYAPNGKYTLIFGVNGQYDKNGDLDSLDVKHFMLVPNLNLNITPNTKTMFSAGYTYNYSKSRGPVAVALFDG